MDELDLTIKTAHDREATIRTLVRRVTSLEDEVSSLRARAESVATRRDRINRHLTMAYTAIREITSLVQDMEDD